MRDFAVCLGKLSLHFWRADFTPEQAKALYGDFVLDLAGVTAQELVDACQEWRTDPLNSFFPTPGKLRELVRETLADRKIMADGAEYLLTLIDAPADTPRGGNMAKQLSDLADKMRVSR